MVAPLYHSPLGAECVFNVFILVSQDAYNTRIHFGLDLEFVITLVRGSFVYRGDYGKIEFLRL